MGNDKPNTPDDQCPITNKKKTAGVADAKPVDDHSITTMAAVIDSMCWNFGDVSEYCKSCQSKHEPKGYKYFFPRSILFI